MRRAQHELAGALVVEIDEARVRVEGVRDVGRDQREHLLQVECRVDRLDRLGQEPQVPVPRVHPPQSVRCPALSTYQWLLALHVTGAFLLVGGSVAAGVLSTMALKRERPSEVALFLGLVRAAVPAIGLGSLLTLVLGLWLVHEAHYSYGDFW